MRGGDMASELDKQVKMLDEIDQLAGHYEAEGLEWWVARGKATDEVIAKYVAEERGGDR
jgi:hypothetical protein